MNPICKECGAAGATYGLCDTCCQAGIARRDAEKTAAIAAEQARIAALPAAKRAALNEQHRRTSRFDRRQMGW